MPEQSDEARVESSSWLARRWQREGRAARCVWGAVVLCLVAATLGPWVLRRASPTYACRAAWHRSPASLPPTQPPLARGDVYSWTSGVAWIVSSSALVSREASDGEDPWGYPWLYEVAPIEQDRDWCLMLVDASRAVAVGKEPRRRYASHLRDHARLAGGLALSPYSRGPDGVDQRGQGDDVLMTPLLQGYSSGSWRVLIAVAYGRDGLLALAAALVWALLTWRVARTRHRTGLGEALASAFLLAVPAAAIVGLCVDNARDLRRSELVASWSDRLWVRPELAVAATLILVAYVGLLAWRLRRAQRSGDEGGFTRG
ncbi:MAG: hypothetical protein KF878_15115 [Planctomycetes bacterium]|nr:hypothetical protein [Planctomycetota bacterium]